MDPLGNFVSQSIKATQRMRGHNWSVDQTTLMLNLLREEQVTHRVTGPGTFTKQVWNRLAPMLSSQSEPHRTSNELQCRWKKLKADFYDYKSCADKSGWGWDAELRIPITPDESCWEESRKYNAKLYKCKSKAFVWYDVMNELCGSNVATGHYAMSGALNGQLEDDVSNSDSSDANLDAMQELNEFDFSAFKNSREVDSNFLFGNPVGGTPVEHLPVLGTSSGKRVREGYVGGGNDGGSHGRKSKRVPSCNNNNNDNNSTINLIVEESRERRMLMNEIKNKGKRIVEKLIKVKKDQGLSSQNFCTLQQALKDEVSKELIMTYEGEELTEWVEGMINYHSLAKP